MIIKFADIMFVFITSPLLLAIIIIRVMFLALLARIGKNCNKSDDQGLLLFHQGDFYSLQKKGVLFAINSDDGFFKSVNIVSFPSKKSEVIKYGGRYTFFEIGKRAPFLKKLKMSFSFTLINLFYYYWSVINLRDFVVKRISLIRGCDPHHTGLAAMLLSFIARTPYCISIHNDYDSIFPDRGIPYVSGFRRIIRLMRKRFEGLTLSRTRFVLPVSCYIADFAIRSGARSGDIRLIRHGIDTKNFDNKTSNGIRDRLNLKNRTLIVSVARISREKHVLDIPVIAKELAQSFPECLFVVAGDGPERKEMERLINEFGVEDNVRLLGFQDQDTVIALRKAADVNLCLFDGYSMIEAALSCRPIVAYDEEWHAELIHDGQTGLLVPNRDTKAAALAIKRMIEDPGLSQLLGKNARDIAIKNHSFTNTSRVKIEIYKEAMHCYQ